MVLQRKEPKSKILYTYNWDYLKIHFFENIIGSTAKLNISSEESMASHFCSFLTFFFFGRSMVISICLWVLVDSVFFLLLILFTVVLTCSLTNAVLWFAFASPVSFPMKGLTEGLVSQQCCHKKYPSNMWSSPLQMILLNSCLWRPLFINDANTRKY